MAGQTILLGVFLLCCVFGKEVVLSTGLGGWTQQQLWSQYTSYKAYADIGIITTSSVLAYYIAENGSLAVYTTRSSMWPAEIYQATLKNDLGLKALPCLYCDATIGNCADLASRLNNLYNNMTGFIDDTISRGKQYGWDGYSVDFEPDTPVEMEQVTNFILEWGKALQENEMYLSVWIGGNVPYNLTQLYNSSYVKLVTMDTYNLSYDEVINVVAPLQTSMYDVNNLGFGLLTNYQTNNKSSRNRYNQTEGPDMVGIVSWSLLTGAEPLSLWASHIPPEWYGALYTYVLEK